MTQRIPPMVFGMAGYLAVIVIATFPLWVGSVMAQSTCPRIGNVSVRYTVANIRGISGNCGRIKTSRELRSILFYP